MPENVPEKEPRFNRDEEIRNRLSDLTEAVNDLAVAVCQLQNVMLKKWETTNAKE